MLVNIPDKLHDSVNNFGTLYSLSIKSFVRFNFIKYLAVYLISQSSRDFAIIIIIVVFKFQIFLGKEYGARRRSTSRDVKTSLRSLSTGEVDLWQVFL